MCCQLLNFFVTLDVLLLGLFVIPACSVSRLAVALLINIPLPVLQVCSQCVLDPNSILIDIAFRLYISTILEQQMLENIRGKGTADMTGELLNWSMWHIYPSEDKWFCTCYQYELI